MEWGWGGDILHDEDPFLGFFVNFHLVVFNITVLLITTLS